MPDSRIDLFGDEPWSPYNRDKLSSYLAGEFSQREMDESLHIPKSPHIHTHFNEAVTHIDRKSRLVHTRYGNVFRYRYLVMATGSRPIVPVIPGVGLQGVYTFRDLNDSHRLFARKARSRNTLVIGGGLLGLEVAKAMRRFNTRVTVVEHNDHLMFRQLDRDAAALLQQRVESLGIKVITKDSIRQILGSLSVQGVELRSGYIMKCDTVILATGIQPNIELAKAVGLNTNRGILVNDRLRTSDPLIYAVGECVEYKGEVYGLVAPGYEQAAVAARAIARKPGRYRGSIAATSLKVVGCPVFSMGDVQERDWQRVDPTYFDTNAGSYRKLVLHRGRLVGVIAVGDWPEIHRLQKLLQQRRRLMPWQLWRFRTSGMLWPARKTHPENLPV